MWSKTGDWPRRLRRTILALAVLALGHSLMGGDPKTADPGGWTKAKWGMTKAKIRTIFPAATSVEESGDLFLGLPDYVIHHRKLAVLFVFDRAALLTAVQLIDRKTLVADDGKETPMVPSDEVSARMNEFVVAQDKDLLLAELTEKYGNPTGDTKSEGFERFQWLFPSTRITLTWFQSESKGLNDVSVFYARREKSADL